MSVGCNGSTGISCNIFAASAANSTNHLRQFHRNSILLREWDLWYVIAPRLNAGINVLWYNASNLNNSYGGAAHNLGVCNTPVNASTCRIGVGGDWVDVFLNLRMQF
jgi:hypothetical protein